MNDLGQHFEDFPERETGGRHEGHMGRADFKGGAGDILNMFVHSVFHKHRMVQGYIERGTGASTKALLHSGKIE